ncbi:MAG: DMT family transporter, partial [Verrucomicrobiaceae bacterium]
TAMVLTLQPLAVLPMAWVIFHNTPGGWKLVGGIVILVGGLWLVSLHRPPHSTVHPEKSGAEEDASVPKAKNEPAEND